jgi:hypothetical protein
MKLLDIFEVHFIFYPTVPPTVERNFTVRQVDEKSAQ